VPTNREISASGRQLAAQPSQLGYQFMRPRVRSSDDKNEVVILFNTDDTKRAMDFVASCDLKETMAKAGVMDKPTFYFFWNQPRCRKLSTRAG
jgi:hypothetical protein